MNQFTCDFSAQGNTTILIINYCTNIVFTSIEEPTSPGQHFIKHYGKIKNTRGICHCVTSVSINIPNINDKI